MKVKDLRNKTISELRQLEQEQKEELRNLRFDLASGKAKNTSEVQKTKKNVARIKTIISEKED